MRSFDRDVADPNTLRAEELVGDWLRRNYGEAVEDTREEKGAYDYALRLTYDVKCSRWLAREGRVHYEYESVYGDGRRRPGWSTKLELEYVIYVNPASWEAHLIRMRHWRAHVQDRLWSAHEEGRDAPRGWIHSESKNPNYVTLAWSMPLDELRAIEGVIVRSWTLQTESAA